MCQILDDNYYSEKYLVQATSQAKSGGIKLPEGHGVGKNLDPNLKPEKQHAMSKKESMERSCIVREELDQEERNLIPSTNELINHPTCHRNSWKNRNRNNKNKSCACQRSNAFHKQHQWQDDKNNPSIPDVPFHPGPVYRPPPKPIKQDISYPQSSQSSTSIEDINPNINFDFEENSPFQEGAMSETFQRPDKSFFKTQKN